MPTAKSSGLNPRFPFIEHANREGFAPSCKSVCDQININPEVQIVCDAGSQQYCTQTPNIVTPECVAFADRAVRTKAFEGTNAIYSNAVKPITTSNITNYYNALTDTAVAYMDANMDFLNTAAVTGLIKTVAAEPSTTKALYKKVADSVVTRCATGRIANPTCGNGVQWLEDRVKEIVQELLTNAQNMKLTELLQAINLDQYFRYNSLYGQINDLIISKLTPDDLANSTLVTIRRELPTMRSRIDLYAINYISNGTLTEIPVSTTGGNTYMIKLVGMPNIYNKSIMTFREMLRTSESTLPMSIAIEAADAENITRTFTVNPFTDKTCIAMRQTGIPKLVTAVDDASVRYCTNSLNVADPKCVDLGQTLADKSAIYRATLTAATKSDGTLDKIMIASFPEMKDWLKSITMDTQSKSTFGEIILTSKCGTESGLTINQCKQICATYPDICLADQLQKCQLPQYRYLTEGFTCNTQEEEDQDSESMMWLFLLLFIICIFVGAYVICKMGEPRKMRSKRKYRVYSE